MKSSRSIKILRFRRASGFDGSSAVLQIKTPRRLFLEPPPLPRAQAPCLHLQLQSEFRPLLGTGVTRMQSKTKHESIPLLRAQSHASRKVTLDDPLNWSSYCGSSVEAPKVRKAKLKHRISRTS
jgi:hypothetical protein